MENLHLIIALFFYEIITQVIAASFAMRTENEEDKRTPAVIGYYLAFEFVFQAALVLFVKNFLL